MVSLVEQRNAYATRLQELVDQRQAEIDEKVRIYREELEKDKITPEMNTLVTFIRQIDAMIAYDNDHAQVESVDASAEPLSKDRNDAEEFDDVKEEDNTCEAVEENISNDADNATEIPTDTCYETLASDIADTRAKLKAVNSGRSGMAGIVLPRR